MTIDEAKNGIAGLAEKQAAKYEAKPQPYFRSHVDREEFEGLVQRFIEEYVNTTLLPSLEQEHTLP